MPSSVAKRSVTVGKAGKKYTRTYKKTSGANKASAPKKAVTKKRAARKTGSQVVRKAKLPKSEVQAIRKANLAKGKLTKDGDEYFQKSMNNEQQVKKQLEAMQKMIEKNAEQLNQKLINLGAPAVVTKQGAPAHVQYMPVCGLPSYPHYNEKSGRYSCRKGTGRPINDGKSKRVAKAVAGDAAPKLKNIKSLITAYENRKGANPKAPVLSEYSDNTLKRFLTEMGYTVDAKATRTSLGKDVKEIFRDGRIV